MHSSNSLTHRPHISVLMASGGLNPIIITTCLSCLYVYRGEAETKNVASGAIRGIGVEDMKDVTIHCDTNEEFPSRTSCYVDFIQR